jgi:hypothetical protein
METYLVLNDLSVHAALREETLLRAIDEANKWAYDSGYDKTGLKRAVSRHDSIIAGDRITDVVDVGFYKFTSANAIRMQAGVFIFLTLGFLLMAVKRLSPKGRASWAEADALPGRERAARIGAAMAACALPALLLALVYYLFVQYFIYTGSWPLVRIAATGLLDLGFGALPILLLVLSTLVGGITAMALPFLFARAKAAWVRIALVAVCAGAFFVLPWAAIAIYAPNHPLIDLLPFSPSFLLPASGMLKDYPRILRDLGWQLLLLCALLPSARIIFLRLKPEKES